MGDVLRSCDITNAFTAAGGSRITAVWRAQEIGGVGSADATPIQSRTTVTTMSEDEQAELDNKTINEEYKTWLVPVGVYHTILKLKSSFKEEEHAVSSATDGPRKSKA